jgi:acetolactate synthase small subunit
MKNLTIVLGLLFTICSANVFGQTERVNISYNSRGGTKAISDNRKEIRYTIKNVKDESQLNDIKSTLKQFKEIYSVETTATKSKGEYSAVLLANKACTTERFEQIVMACGFKEMEVDGKLIPVNKLHESLPGKSQNKAK